MAKVQAFSWAARSPTTRPFHMQPSPAATQGTFRFGHRPTCARSSPTVVFRLQNAQTVGCRAMAFSATKFRMGSLGSATRHVGHCVPRCLFRCSVKHSAQKRWPLRHWWTWPSGVDRQMAQSYSRDTSDAGRVVILRCRAPELRCQARELPPLYVSIATPTLGAKLLSQRLRRHFNMQCISRSGQPPWAGS